MLNILGDIPKYCRRANGWISRNRGIEIHVNWCQGRRKFPFSTLRDLLYKSNHVSGERYSFSRSLVIFLQILGMATFLPCRYSRLGPKYLGMLFVLGCILRRRRSHQVFLQRTLFPKGEIVVYINIR
jgi:hypothetical protein